ncbi:hypothetical protein JCM14469_29580 [Desulfatiferula olefinivorans]
MEINYKTLLPMSLKAMYSDLPKRDEVKRKLDAYGKESFHSEQSRVKLGILYLASQEPEKLDSFIDLACIDYRDLLCSAEYPHSSRRWGIREKDCEKYKKLQDKGGKEYLAWVETIKKA